MLGIIIAYFAGAAECKHYIETDYGRADND